MNTETQLRLLAVSSKEARDSLFAKYRVSNDADLVATIEAAGTTVADELAAVNYKATGAPSVPVFAAQGSEDVIKLAAIAIAEDNAVRVNAVMDKATNSPMHRLVVANAVATARRQDGAWTADHLRDLLTAREALLEAQK